MQTELKA